MTPADKARSALRPPDGQPLTALGRPWSEVDGSKYPQMAAEQEAELAATLRPADRTTAEEIAGRFGNDGACWENDGEEIGDVVYLARAWDYAEATRTRYEFADGSSIVLDHPQWRLGFTGRHLRCVCWPEVHPNHEETCEERESWNL